MKDLNFQEGYEVFQINGDPSRVIRFNPADPEFLNRLLKMKDDFSQYQVSEDVELNLDGTAKTGIEKDAAYIAEFSKAMRQAFNQAFNADVYDILFDGQSPLCIVGEGSEAKYLFEVVSEALFEAMAPAIQEYNRKSEQKMSRYLGDIGA